MEIDHGNGSTRNQKPKSLRQQACDLGVSHTFLWRCMLMAEIPDEMFENMLAQGREAQKMPSQRQFADVARRLRGDIIPDDYEHCPHCGEVIRKRD